MADVTTISRLSTQQVAEVLALAEYAAATDGIAPLSEQVTLSLRDLDERARTHVLLSAAGRVVGYAQLDPGDPEGTAAELFVVPEARGNGYGRALASGALAATTRGTLRVWAHGELPAAVALADRLGFRRVRALWQMGRTLGAASLPEPRLPDGVTLRPFMPGQDDEGWLAANARAFAGHPEQGRVTRRDLRDRMRQPWFDPAGFLLAERAGTIVGFHWTKVADGTGEVYVIGVDPSEQGHGLGKALLLAGLHHLAARDLPRAILYTESDNPAAIGLYTRLGFTHDRTDTMFAHPISPGPPPNDHVK
ncbi:MAG: mycothiol synthase [Nocardioidaceae bacterium]